VNGVSWLNFLLVAPSEGVAYSHSRSRRPFSRHSFHSWKCKSPPNERWQALDSCTIVSLESSSPSHMPSASRRSFLLLLLNTPRSSSRVDLLSPILSCRVLSLFIFLWNTLRFVQSPIAFSWLGIKRICLQYFLKYHYQTFNYTLHTLYITLYTYIYLILIAIKREHPIFVASSTDLF